MDVILEGVRSRICPVMSPLWMSSYEESQRYMDHRNENHVSEVFTMILMRVNAATKSLVPRGHLVLR